MIDEDDRHLFLTAMQHIQLTLLDDDTVTPAVKIIDMPIMSSGFKYVSIYSLFPYG